MNKHLIVSGIVVLLICVGLSGCNEEGKEKEKSKTELIIGTWQRTDVGQEYIWIFYDNGKLTINVEYDSTYYINGDILVFYSNPSYKAECRMYFQGDDTLTLRDVSDGYEFNFYRID